MKPLMLNESAIANALELYRQQLLSGSVTPPDEKPSAKININFTPIAWEKQHRLIQDFNTEVAWHGLMRQLSPTQYEVYDILVYPQRVTGATFRTDQNKYNDWLISQPDEIFNNIRFHAHSHVNMAPYPSGLDEENEAKMVRQLSGDDFYLYMILNKRGDYTARLYDHGANKVYNESDITLTHTDPLFDFIKTAKSLASETPLQTAPILAAVWDNTTNCWVDPDGNCYDHYPTEARYESR